MKIKLAAITSGAAMAFAPTAYAADLPQDPKTVEPINYVNVCDAYGAGYFQLPGKSTCINIRGRIRTQAVTSNFADDEIDIKASDNAFGGDEGKPSSKKVSVDEDDYSAYARGYLWFDTMTAAEWGFIKTTAGFALDYANDKSDAVLKNEDVFIQLGTDAGTVLIGREASNFDGLTGDVPIGAVGQNFSDTSVLQFAATADLGNGLTATLAAESSDYRDGPDDGVDIVGKLNYGGGWGSLQLAAAYHQVDDVENAFSLKTSLSGETTESFKVSTEDSGFALGATLKLNLDNLNIGSGTSVTFQSQYAENAASYMGGRLGISQFDNVFNSETGYNQFYDLTGSTDGLGNEGWNVSGSITQKLTDTVSLIVDASYAQFERDATGSFGYEHTPTGGTATATVATVSDDYEATRVAIDGALVFDLAPGLIWALNAGWGQTEVDYSFATNTGKDGDGQVTNTKFDTDFTEARIGTRIQYTF